ncbi:hypothetical protein D3C81_1565480 [compost metagenome]
MEHGRHFPAVVCRMGAPLLYDGTRRNGQRDLLDHDDGDCRPNRGQNLQLAVYAAKGAHRVYDADAVFPRLYSDLYDRRGDGGHAGDGERRLSIS